MGLKFNIAYNYVSQFYVAILGFVMLPFYVKYMGIDAYGIIGFFTMTQAWFQLLDFGLSQTFSREAAKFTTGKCKKEVLISLFKVLEISFFVIGIAIIIAWYVFSDFISTHWLHIDGLDYYQVNRSIELFGVIIGGRLLSGVYRGGLVGLEKNVITNNITLFIATMRSITVIPVMIFVSNSILTFFLFQTIIVFIELTLYRYFLLKFIGNQAIKDIEMESLGEAVRFGLGMAILSWIWIGITQFDKLLLSHILTISEYGVFALIVTISSGVNFVASPFQQAVAPRLVCLVYDNKTDVFLNTYRLTTISLASLLSSIICVVAGYPEQIIYLFTGKVVSDDLELTLIAYSAGNYFACLTGVTYLLQHAYGNLRLHIKSNIIVMIFILPMIMIFTLTNGALGASLTWFFVNLVTFFVLPVIIHKKFVEKITWEWFYTYTFPSIFYALVIILIQRQIQWKITSRIESGCGLFLIGCLTILLMVVAQKDTRQFIKQYIRL